MVGMIALLTGAGGFLGRRVAGLLAAEHRVLAVTREDPGDRIDEVEWLRLDLADPAVELPGNIDAVVHLAQSRRYRDFPEGAADVFAVNLAATFRLAEHARRCGARKFVLASTGGVYGPGKAAREDDPVLAAPPDGALGFYVRSKLAAELIVESYASLMETVILRPFFIYGPGQSRMLVRVIAERVLAGEAVSVQGRAGMRVNPIYVDDAARAVQASLAAGPAGVFNLAGEEVVTIAALAELTGELAGVEVRLEHVDGEPADVVADTTRLREVLGLARSTALRDGLQALLSSLR
jgi:UDP-glucose 4-epimerase